MMDATGTAKEVGRRIGRAMARDVIAEGMPRGWTGLDPQDADQIPEGVDAGETEREARAEYERVITGAKP